MLPVRASGTCAISATILSLITSRSLSTTCLTIPCMFLSPLANLPSRFAAEEPEKCNPLSLYSPDTSSTPAMLNIAAIVTGSFVMGCGSILKSSFSNSTTPFPDDSTSLRSNILDRGVIGMLE